MHIHITQAVHQLEQGSHMWRSLTEDERRGIMQYYARLQAQREQRVLDLLSSQ